MRDPVAAGELIGLTHYMIYLIADTEKKYCKIGYSSSPKRRLGEIQTSCPLEMNIILTIKGNMNLEKEFHRKFNHLRIRYEWFEYHEDVIEYIRNYRDTTVTKINPKSIIRKTVPPIKTATVVTEEIREKLYAYIAVKYGKYNVIRMTQGVKGEVTQDIYIPPHLIIDTLEELIIQDRVYRGTGHNCYGIGNYKEGMYRLRQEWDKKNKKVNKEVIQEWDQNNKA